MRRKAGLLIAERDVHRVPRVLPRPPTATAGSPTDTSLPAAAPGIRRAALAGSRGHRARPRRDPSAAPTSSRSSARGRRCSGASARFTSSSGSFSRSKSWSGIARRVDELPAPAAEHDHRRERALGQVLAGDGSRPARRRPRAAARGCVRRRAPRARRTDPGERDRPASASGRASDTGSRTRRASNRPGACTISGTRAACSRKDIL